MQKRTTGIRNLRFKEYKEIKVPVPPIREQKRIVKKLEKILSKIEEAKKLRREAVEETKRIIQSALQQVFSKTEKKGWKERELVEVAKIFAGSSAPQGQRYFEGG